MPHLLLKWNASLHQQLCTQGLHLLVEHTLPAPAAAPVSECITLAPMEFVEAALHEIDEELCRDEMDELCYVVRMGQKRIWRRVWHSHSTPSDASKSEGTWRALSARLCCKEECDEMKRACAYLGLLPGARLHLAFRGLRVTWRVPRTCAAECDKGAQRSLFRTLGFERLLGSTAIDEICLTGTIWWEDSSKSCQPPICSRIT